MAVVRLESWTPPLPDVEEVARPILADAANPAVRAVEIDFDARRSERAWYGALLERLRRGLGASKPLGITALASWCLGDPWVRTLAVSDAVPMLFRMGVGEAYHPGEDFRPGVCRSSVGVSTDEPLPEFPRGRRVYIFHPRSWSVVELRAAVHEVQRWE